MPVLKRQQKIKCAFGGFRGTKVVIQFSSKGLDPTELHARSRGKIAGSGVYLEQNMDCNGKEK